MEPRTISGSRVKSALFLTLTLPFVFIGAAGLQTNPKAVELWLCVLFFGLGVVVFTILTIKPNTLHLDNEAFTIRNSLGRRRRTLWRDIGPFFLLRLPRGGNLIAYNYLPGNEPKSPLLKISRAMGADAGIPGLWSMSKKNLVGLLNEYRDRGLDAKA